MGSKAVRRMLREVVTAALYSLAAMEREPSDPDLALEQIRECELRLHDARRELEQMTRR